MTNEQMTSKITSTNEHLQAIHAECSGFVDGEPPDLEVIIQHAEALAAQIERLQHLWDAWGRSRGYATDSKPYGAFLDALKACEVHGDLLPLEGSNGR